MIKSSKRIRFYVTDSKSFFKGIIFISLYGIFLKAFFSVHFEWIMLIYKDLKKMNP